jgi:predicted ATPase/signal transduction histidine kinase/tRNA A-37 threonylcarbamoyl transferase component Bud32
MAETAPVLRIDGIVHSGARTTIYRATRVDDGVPVILKVLTTHHDTAVHRARLHRELAITRQIESPAVVRAYGTTSHEGRLGLVLEDFGGTSLARQLPMIAGLGDMLDIAIAIVRSLRVVHHARIVHRDVKPSNVIFSAATGELKITDFGLAVDRGDIATGPGIEGTFAYMAPEQSGRTRRIIDGRADLYSLGVVLYELFTGGRPFDAQEPLEWIHRHAAETPRPPSAVNPAIPEALSLIIVKLLAKGPEERYQTAEGVAYDLERCRESARIGKRLAPFKLAERDVPDEFALPERVYGREPEIAALRASFERVAQSSATQVMVISGAPGVGKTALVGELEASVAARQGYSASGKFDQYRGHLPYSAVVQAGNELVQQLLAASAAQLGAFRDALQSALDGSCGTLIALFPELERVLGPQPAVVDLPPHAAQNRLQHAMRAFLRAFAAPVVVFLDDLQWADEATVDLVEALLAHAAHTPLLLVLAHREQELGHTHRLSSVLEDARGAGVPVETLALAALDADGVRALVGDTLRARGPSIDALAALAMAKTRGNPFFVREFLRTLHLDGLLRIDAERGVWLFDPAEVGARQITDNVVDLLIRRLEQLPLSAREALALAAFIGTELDIDDLALLSREDAAVVTEGIHAAVESGLLAMAARPDGKRVVRFGHDRIQQAAFALTPEPERAAVHLAVGRLLWSRLGEDPPVGPLLEVANHLDAAMTQVVDTDERARLLGLFLLAGRKATNANAYRQASTYLTRATELLTAGGWDDLYAMTFDVHIALAECDYLGGRLDRAQAGFVELLRRARTDLDRARVHYLQIRLLQVAGDLAQATELALQSFALLGLHPPGSVAEAAQAVDEEHRVARELLGDRPIASHVDDPPMTDPRMRLLVDLLEASGPPIYMVRPELFSWIALQLVNLSLRHGNAEASCYGYGIYALLRAAVQGDVEGGYELSQLAIRLNEKLGALKLEGCMLHLLGDHVNFWRNPIASDLPLLERGFAACVRGGDHIYSNYIGFQAPWHLYESGAPLASVMALTETYARFARETKYEAVHWTIRAEQQFVRALAGETDSRGSLQSRDFDEAEALAAVTKARFGCGIVYLHILNLVARYTFGDHAGALESADAAAPELGSAFSMPIYVTYGFYRALTLAALHATSGPEKQLRYVEEMRAQHDALTAWAAACPANFADKKALLGAELARVTGDLPAALRMYESARLAARSQGFVPYEALACELAASAYGAIGVDSFRRALLADAHALYRRWGATDKAAQLASSNQGLEADGFDARTSTVSSSSSSTSTATPTSLGGDLDLASVLKAAQSISAEIVLPRLLVRLISIVIEYAGAERGALLLLHDDELTMAAEAAIGLAATDGDSASAVAPRDVSALPASVLRYVQRTGQAVMLDDASGPHRFSADPYFRSPHRSVLCKPVESHGRLLGMFYLENDLLARAFNPARLSALDVLASQTAISIENSRLYEAAVAAVAARDEFLSIAAHELRTPLTPLSLQMHRLIGAIEAGTLRSMPEASLAKMAKSCEGQIARLSRQVTALLDVARVGHSAMMLQRERTDLSDVVASVIEEQVDLRVAAGCTVAFHGEKGIVGSWDPMRLAQLAANLLLNALKFGRGGAIEVTVARADSGAHLQVRDHGIGVELRDRQRIFERFERIRSVDNVDGLGLGLFIVRAIAEAHGGRVTVAETAGGGATFDVWLPG